MNVKKKLLISHISVVLMVVLIFGSFSYKLVLDTFIEKEKHLVVKLSKEKAGFLATEYRTHASLNYFGKLIEKREGSDLSIVVDKNNNIIFPEKIDEDPILVTWKHLLKKHVGETNVAITEEQDEKFYVWAISPVKGTSYSLAYLSTNMLDIFYAPVMILSTRMMVIGGIILWAAIWVSLIASSAISMQLDEQRKALEHQATHDQLTGLANRILLQSKTDQAIKEAQANKSQVALILMDLNHFKVINDTLGHKVGDRLIQEIGHRMKKYFNDAKVIARLGGDEFAFTYYVSNNYQAMQLVDKIISSIDKPVSVDGLSLDVKGSIGVAIAPEHGENAMTLIRRADVAMYQAKKSGGGFSIYDPEKDPHSLEHLNLMNDLRHAIEKDQLDLFYQPKIDMKTGKIIGNEALCRWRHPEKGMISPDIFIGLAEQIGMIKPITLWVLYVGINQCKKWHRAGYPLNISINISANLLQDTQLPTRISDALKNENLPPEYLTLEITETAIMNDPVRAMEILKQLSYMGVHLSLDDFGTGYTSLSYLKHLPVDEIKIDKSFVMDMLNDSDDATIVHSIISLAHSMKHHVVAEGVESDETWVGLEALGCDTAQGFHMARPMPADELEKWFEESSWGFGKGYNNEKLA